MAPAQKKRRLPSSFASGFLLGLLSGVTLVGLLVWLPGQEAATPNVNAVISPDPGVSEPDLDTIDWSFYDLFPKAEVATVSGYQSARDPEAAPSIYHLQTGSFGSPRDADERRAALLLLGLPAFVEPKIIGEKTWYRVLVGPVSSETDLNRVQMLLATNDFESIPIANQP